MSEIQDITVALLRFRDERKWKQFHKSKDLALALSIEAAELNELFLWKTTKECDKVSTEIIGDELADIFAYAFLMAEKLGLDVRQIILAKLEKNAKKYPIDRSKNSSKKYNQL